MSAELTFRRYRAHCDRAARILQAESRGLAMIFCRTKRTAADIAEQLERRADDICLTRLLRRRLYDLGWQATFEGEQYLYELVKALSGG